MEVALLPVTKVQFEQFMGEMNAFDNAWYEEILAVNPRISWRSFARADREKVFLTGLSPLEAQAFLCWLGRGFRLPTPEQWRKMDRWWQSIPLERADFNNLLDSELHVSARAILSQLVSQLRIRGDRARTWGDLMLWREGVAEWTDSHGEYCGLGRPRHTTWNPQDEHQRPIVPLPPDSRHRYFGVRPFRVRRIVRTEDSNSWT